MQPGERKDGEESKGVKSTDWTGEGRLSFKGYKLPAEFGVK